MKIDEFIEKVNKVAYAKKDGDCIYICDGETTSYQDYYFLAFLVTSKSMDLDWEWKHLRLIEAYKLRTILNLVKELQDTPVKERFPERKYYLCVFPKKETLKRRGESGAIWVNHIRSFDVGFRIDYGPKTAFTEETLNTIKESLPFIAPSIDAMKIPVEEISECR